MAHVHRSLILLLGALTAFGPLTIDMYLPSLPTLEQSFAVSAAAVQMTVAAFFIGLAVGQAFYGPISDAYGRKMPLIVGLVVYVAASIGCTLANDVSTMIGLRFVQAIGSSAGMVIARAVVRDYVTGQEAARIFSTLMLVMGVAPVLAPLLGGYVLVWFGWRAIFIALAVFGLACLVASATLLPETLPAAARRRSGVIAAVMTYARLSRDRRFMGFALSGGFAMASLFVYIAISPHLFITVYGLTPRTYSWLFGLNAFGLIAASQLNRFLLRHMSLYRVLAIGLAINLCAAAILVVVAATGLGGPIGLLLPLFLTIASLGLIGPNAGAAAMSGDPRTAGSASALMGTIPFVAGAAMGAIAGAMADSSALSMTEVMACCSVVAVSAHTLLVGRSTDGDPHA